MKEEARLYPDALDLLENAMRTLMPMSGRHYFRAARPAAWHHATVYEYVGPPLTRDSLASLLDRLGVQPRAYSLYGAHSPDANVMDHRREGWVVFYTERGDESGLVTYGTEAEACLELLDRVTSEDHNFFELVAGPAPPDVADTQFQSWLKDHSLSRDRLSPGDWKTQDSPWVANEPDYRRYWVRTTAVRRLQ